MKQPGNYLVRGSWEKGDFQKMEEKRSQNTYHMKVEEEHWRRSSLSGEEMGRC